MAIRTHIADLCKRYRPTVLAAAEEVLGSRDDAEDVAQRVFLRLLKRAGDFSADGLTEGYFHRAGRREALTFLRERAAASRRVQKLQYATERGSAPAPDELLAWKTRRRALITALQELPQRSAEVARLIYLEEHTTTEAAEELGIGVKRVERHRQRVRELLRKRFWK